MSVNLGLVLANWQSILVALVAVLLVKAIVTGGLLRLSGASTGVAAETGVLMASPSETTLIVLGSATAAQLIRPETAAFWQIVTALGLTITPLLGIVGRSAGRRIDRTGDAALGDALQQGKPGKVIIVGFGRVGRIVADMLTAHNLDYVAVDADADSVHDGRNSGYNVIFGDVSRGTLVERLHQGQPTAVILTMDNPVLVARLAKRLRLAYPDLPIIARARDTAHAARLYRAGVTDAVPETLEASLQLSEAALVDLGIAMGPVIASIHEKRDELRAKIKDEAELEEEPRLGRRRLRDIQPEAGSNRSTPAT
jgi:CPA2 family monovalent cation:H+ antiporter-2